MVWVFLMNRMGSQGSTVAQRRRMALGVVILLLVDIIWVVSSELTSYIFKRQEYNKPFFSTFTKTSMFVLYLLGFLLWRPWRQQCTGSLRGRHAAFFADAEAYFTPCINDTSLNDHTLSEPLYVPVKFQDLPTEQTNCAIGDCDSTSKKQRVRFSNIMEVRQLPSTQALEAKLSRMSYPAAKDHESMLRTVGKLTVTDVAKISFFFCFVWFLANLSYQEALSDTQVAIVNILSSTSGLFTLILAAIFPSNSSDRFTLSKLLAVALSMGGVVLVSFSSMDSPDGKGTIGSLWSLAGAALYAVYIVMIKRKVDREDKLDIPMFFAFAFIVEGMSVTPRPVLWCGIDLEVEGSSWSGAVSHSIIGLSLLSLQAILMLCVTGKTSFSLIWYPSCRHILTDNATSHTARSVHDFLQDMNVSVLPWPAGSQSH
ncbi:solute carrier family 35 member F5-like isoform X2 [Oncorhynchus nerka]|uniref:solute carrier family 35 member F5-like isoform X2 n=1 Tax=Oncorhynchus nerka TaxID=8023 RepID=UPI0031B85F9D